ncbi:MAG: cysteine desulfurase family protein [Xanthomonadales bacterium]
MQNKAVTPPRLPIYLDYNASTPVLPEVVDAMLPYLREHFGNPSSNHIFGRTMHHAVGRAREQVAHLIECSPGEVYFTSGGTEANNLAIRGAAAAIPARRHLLTCLIEHPATAGPSAWLEQKGYRVTRVPVDGAGRVLPERVQECLGQETALVTIMHANSETGTLQPIAEIAELAHSAGALMHTDAAQSCGKIRVSTRHEKVDLLSIAGHKLYAPQGVGVLFVRAGTPINPLLIGAGHEHGLRPGTENVASIVGLGQACEIARRSLVEEGARLSGLRDRLWRRLREAIPGMALNGYPAERLPNTLNVRFPGVAGNALLAACPAIAASTGSACHELGDRASEVILAMGIAQSEAIGSVRLSLGRLNTREEIDLAATELIKAWNKLQVLLQ